MDSNTNSAQKALQKENTDRNVENKKEHSGGSKSKISYWKTTIPNLTGSSLLNGLRSPLHQVKMKMKRQRMKRWPRTDGKRRENEKMEKEKVAGNIW